METGKRLINANALKVKAFPDPDSGERIVYVQDIDEAPTVDAVEVVRCKDCKHFVPFVEPYNKAGMCNRKMLGLIPEEGFCSYGERRTDGQVH